MKSYKNKEEIITDLKIALRDDDICEKYILERLDNPDSLIKEFIEEPFLALAVHGGEWLIWKNTIVRIDNEQIQTEDILNKLSMLLKVDHVLNNMMEALSYAINHAGSAYINKDIFPEIREVLERVREGELNRALELRKFNAHPEGSGSDNDVLLMEAIADSRSQALQSWMTDLVMVVEENQENEN